MSTKNIILSLLSLLLLLIVFIAYQSFQIHRETHSILKFICNGTGNGEMMDCIK